jgi:hypothetical protein
MTPPRGGGAYGWQVSPDKNLEPSGWRFKSYWHTFQYIDASL